MNKKILLLIVLGLYIGLSNQEIQTEVIITENEPVADKHEVTNEEGNRNLADSKLELDKENLSSSIQIANSGSDTQNVVENNIELNLDEIKDSEERNLSDNIKKKDARDLSSSPQQIKLEESSLIEKVTYPPSFRATSAPKRSSGQNIKTSQFQGSTRSKGSKGGAKPSRNDSFVNYLHVVIDENTGGGSKTTIVSDYLKKFMGIKKNEELSVEAMKIDNKVVANRYKVLRINRRNQSSREYTVDVDFADGNNDKSIYKSAKQVPVTSNGTDKFYLNDYEYTLQKDCEVIRANLKDPISIECIPFVNDHSYVLPQFYRVKYSFLKGGKEVNATTLVNVIYSNAQITLEKIKPRGRGKLPKIKAVIQLIQDRIKEIPYFEHKEKVLKETRKPDFVKKVEGYEKEILDFQNKNRKKIIEGEKQYQDNLKVALAKVQITRQKDNRDFGLTYEIMMSKTEEINAFNIRTAIRRALSDLENEQVYQVYRSKVRHYRRETALTNLLDRMDYMRYLADKHLDDNFEHYHTAEYFKK